MTSPDPSSGALLGDPEAAIAKLTEELRNAKEEIRNLLDLSTPLVPKPGHIPRIAGIDIYGESIPLHGAMGGDHIIFIDFNRRYDIDKRIACALAAGKQSVADTLRATRHKAGILVADVSGHSLTDAALAARLHDAFLSCVLYELDLYGTITTRVFETLNLRFYNSTTVTKFITMIYGEVSEDGTFRFISAGHPAPIVFSNDYGKFVDIAPDRFATFAPLGTQPPESHVDREKLRANPLGYKKKYEVNEISLMGRGDIMVLFSDGLSDYTSADGSSFLSHLEVVLRSVKHLGAVDIWKAIREAIPGFGAPGDDITYVVVKKSE
jgi:serine phosphatase RsbU (regulator of sigma subunit)